MNRRKFLGGASLVGLGALAGCTNAVGTVAAPEVPQDQLQDGGWEQTNRTEETVFEESYGPVTVTAKSTTLTFSDKVLAASVKDKTLSQIDGTLAIFSASHINFSPDLNNLPGGIGREELLDQVESAAKDQFEQRMRDNGLENVRETGEEEFETDSGASPGLTTFSAEFPVGDISYDAGGVGKKEIVEQAEQSAREQFKQRMRDEGLENVLQTGEEEFQTDSGASPGLTTFSADFPVGTIEYDTGAETFSIDVGAIEVAGDLAVWNSGDYVVVAGGAYPAESFSTTTQKDLSEAISVTVDIDLGLTPEDYRTEVRNLIAGTR